MNKRQFERQLFKAIKAFEKSNTDGSGYQHFMDDLSIGCTDEQWQIVNDTLEMVGNPDFITLLEKGVWGQPLIHENVKDVGTSNKNPFREAYEKVWCQRMDAGMVSETYEEFLERRLHEANRKIDSVQKAIAQHLDAELNEHHYRTEGGMGDQEINLMQYRTRQTLIQFITNFGWDVTPHIDGGYVIRNDHTQWRVLYGSAQPIAFTMPVP